jgi:hypothetical protein
VGFIKAAFVRVKRYNNCSEGLFDVFKQLNQGALIYLVMFKTLSSSYFNDIAGQMYQTSFFTM